LKSLVKSPSGFHTQLTVGLLEVLRRRLWLTMVSWADCCQCGIILGGG